MHGNVVEWGRDGWGTPHVGRDPEVTEGTDKVQRGGYWNMPTDACRSGARFMAPPGLRKLEFGFRVALSYRNPRQAPAAENGGRPAKTRADTTLAR